MNLEDFVRESWRIEGLTLSDQELKRLAQYHRQFAKFDIVSIVTLANAAKVFTGGFGRLRDRPGMDVRIGTTTRRPAGQKP